MGQDNPLDANFSLRILSLTTCNLLAWLSVSGKTCRVLGATNLPANFAPISGVITAASGMASFLDTSATNSRRFYRVNVLP